jgi:hypothetical protein
MRRFRYVSTLTVITAVSILSSATAAEVFNQNFQSSTTLSSYISATPTSGQFNDISAETSGGTWSINAGTLQLVRAGNSNGAGITRFTDFAATPGLLHVKFNFGVTINSFQNDLMGLDFGNFTSVQDYNNTSPTTSVFTRLNVDGAGSNNIRFEIGGTQSATYAANGTLYALAFFLNKSGVTQNYLAPNGTVKFVDANRVSFWVGPTCLFDNVVASNGATSTLTDLRLHLGTADTGTWKLDDFVVNDAFPAAGPAKLTLLPSMVINEVAQGDAGMLVDEQALAGDPAGGTGGAPVTKFNVGSSWYYPARAIIDLGALHDITKISFYDSNGVGNVTVSKGTPFNWTALFTDGQTLYNSWKTYTMPAGTQTRYLQISIASGAAIPTEFVVYGTPLGTPVAPPNPTPQTPPVFEQFLGANGFIDDPIGRLEAVGYIREYHNWTWDEGNGGTYPGYPGNLNGFNPSYSGNWNFDRYYAGLLRLGSFVVPAIKEGVAWLGTPNTHYKPILWNSGRDPEVPASYVEHADHLYQYAARYGAAAVSDSLLKLKAGQPRITGVNSLGYYENWNEQDKWWEGLDSYFSPYTYAAMSSADYDGHQGTMGATIGLKNADPNGKLVMSGLAKLNLDYIKAMKLWCDYKRGGSFPWKVINFHQYCNDAGGQGGTPTIGVSPETDNLKGRMETIRDYRDRYLPGVELWLSEFGYDTNASSPQRAPAIGTFSAEEVQGQWLVRSYLALVAAGVDRAAMFMSRNSNDAGTGKFETSGLTSTGAAGFVPKISWYYVYTLKNRLKGLRYAAEQSSGNTNVKIYQFKDAGGAIKAYAVWCPTSNQTTVANYVLTLQGSPTSAKLVTLTNGDIDGVATALTLSSGHVTINVSERPVIVLVNDNNPDVTLDTKMTLTSAMVTNETGKGNAALLVDEQAATGDPDMGTGAIMNTVWSPGSQAADHPASCYIDLGQSYQITKIYLFDKNSAGDFIISTGSPGNWTVLATEPCASYNSWAGHGVNLSTRYIRVTRQTGGSNVAEVVVYRK